MIGNLIRATVKTALLPVAVVADVVTMGGDYVDGGDTHTGRAVRKISNELDQI